MKKFIRNICIILFVVFVVYLVIKLSQDKPTKDQTINSLVDDINLENMRSDLNNQVKIHKEYISHLRSMNSEIKSIGHTIENKIEMAKSFGDIGDAYIKSNFLPMALANYSLGLEIFPQDPILNYKKGLILANYGTYDPSKQAVYYKQAQGYYKTAGNINKSYADPHYSLALLYFISSENKIDIGSLKEAMDEINLYFQLTKAKKNIEAYFLKARIAYALGDKNISMQSYQSIMNNTKIGSEAYIRAKNNTIQLSGSF